MTENEPVVFVVDDDFSVRRALHGRLMVAGFPVEMLELVELVRHVDWLVETERSSSHGASRH
jgi:FixJ family two-component response regulator